MNKINAFIKNELSGWKVWEVCWLAIAIAAISSLSLYWGDNVRGITAGLTGVICVVLTGKGKLSSYIFGLVNVILYALISFESKYYGEVMLNALYFLPMQFVGWSMWKKHMNTVTKEVIKTKLSVQFEIILLITSVVCIFGYGILLQKIGGNLPFVDSVSTCLSVLAMYLSVKRLMEQWVIWIVVNIATIYMWVIDYLNGGTDIAVLLMWCIFLINAIFMWVKWYKESRRIAYEL